jgi:hypothetical protein
VIINDDKEYLSQEKGVCCKATTLMTIQRLQTSQEKKRIVFPSRNIVKKLAGERPFLSRDH